MQIQKNVLLAAVAVSSLLAAPAVAEERPREATIIVSGEGEASLAPDMAIMTMAVVKQAETAEQALADNNGAMASVLADLKATGIEDRDLQTTGFSISPQYRQEPDGNGGYKPPVIIGYQVSNSLTLRIRDLAKLGEVIDRSVKLGINQGGEINFTNNDPEAAVTEARKAAMQEAMAKAKTLTEAAGVSLGRVIEISENFARPMPQPMFRAAAAKEVSDAVPMASGENTYTVTVNVTFGIDPE
ncbi:SIMPL domain-containing protein [Rhizobium sp. RU36D]|uniref:SIMPL domain-containing protein n=1 Tax=Rhizobium sp. RU36D TaxID=1907415 RepID=UPI0009D800EB|nr:SIMPL domain-containing protein [Rhizobium sp. RU36D]SMC60454.1 hypothetical protein SAMN05880593_103183 [Rhizobium sp. RU36D]